MWPLNFRHQRSGNFHYHAGTFVSTGWQQTERGTRPIKVTSRRTDVNRFEITRPRLRQLFSSIQNLLLLTDSSTSFTLISVTLNIIWCFNTFVYFIRAVSSTFIINAKIWKGENWSSGVAPQSAITLLHNIHWSRFATRLDNTTQENLFVQFVVTRSKIRRVLFQAILNKHDLALFVQF